MPMLVMLSQRRMEVNGDDFMEKMNKDKTGKVADLFKKISGFEIERRIWPKDPLQD
jgi:hypothetical protein